MLPYASLPADARRVVVRDLSDATAALAAAAAGGQPVVLLSAPGAAAYQGPDWLLRVARIAATAAPDAQWSLLVDAGDAAGLALGALEAGVPAVAVAGLPPTAMTRLHAIAHTLGATVLERDGDEGTLMNAARGSI